jgi:hypothetical protein
LADVRRYGNSIAGGTIAAMGGSIGVVIRVG